MSGDTVLIEVSPGETRAARLDHRERLTQLEVERMGDAPVSGAVHLGRVVRVEPGMGAAFVEIGAEQPGFLGKMRDVTEGQAVIVQVLRPADGGKGAVLTAAPVLPGRYVSLDATRPGIHFPQRWPGDREELVARLEAIAPAESGLAPQPRAAEAGEATLRSEVEHLMEVWAGISERAARAKPPAELLPAPRLIDRVLREAEGRIVVDDPREFSRIRGIVEARMPELAGALELWRGDTPLFETAGVEEQIEAALAPDVPLPGGGSLLIEETEALTAIDVNMGGAGGRLPSEAAILKANQAAAREAARQIQLRNIGGLIVIDFISMRNKGNRRTVLEAMRREMREDPVRHDVLGLTPGGLVEITRQRTGTSLASWFATRERRSPEILPEAAACAALRAALRQSWSGRPVLAASPEIVAALRGPLAPALEEVSRRLGRPLDLRAEPGRGHDAYEILSEKTQGG